MASRLKAEIEKATSAVVSLIEGSGGVFEIEKDGEMLFSKRKEGRFPEDEEILSRL